MKIKTKFITSIVFVFFSANSSAWNIPVAVEEAIELKPSVYYLGKSLNGKIYAKRCDNCEVLKLTITPKTRAFVANKEVILSSRVSSTVKPELTLYDPKTNKVTRLFW